MPLIPGKSPAAMSANIKTEMAAGKPQKQAIAIGYAERGEGKEGNKGMGEHTPKIAKPAMPTPHDNSTHLLHHHVLKEGTSHDKEHYGISKGR